MKTIKFLILVVTMAILTTACQPDKSALQRAKAEGIKIGYDSAKKLVLEYDSTLSSFSLNKFTFPDPRPYVHTHTGTMQKSIDASIESGTLVVVGANPADDPNHQHNTLYSIPFINSKGLTEQQLMTMKPDAPPSSRSLVYKVAELELPSNPPVKVKVAYDVIIR